MNSSAAWCRILDLGEQGGVETPVCTHQCVLSHFSNSEITPIILKQKAQYFD